MAVGRSVPMLDAQGRVTGQVPYLINLQLPGMLVAKIVRSPLPHARLGRVDARAAETAPGVAAVLTRDDLPPGTRYGIGIPDQPIVADDRVRFVGEPVAVIAAENRDAAEAASWLVDIEYDELPAVFDAQEAMQADAPQLHEAYANNLFKHSKLRHGDVKAGFAAADEIFEDTFTSPVAQHASLEPHVTIAQWVSDESLGDRLTVWSATQAPYMVRNTLAGVLGIPPENVRVIVHPLGGGYGGKGHVRLEPLVAAMARKTAGRPVKLVLAREEEFVTVTKHAATITIRTGVRRDGTLAARQVTIFWNGGAYADASAMLVPAGMVRAVGPYRIPAVQVDSYGVYTNLPPAAAFRGAMSSQTTWAYESQMDIIARKMGWDPLEFRLKNLLREGETFATGETMHDVHFVECLRAVKMPEPDGGGGQNPARDTTARGVGYAVMMKSTVGTSKSEARIVLDRQNVATLYTSTVEMGQGAHTAMAQITAEALDIPFEQVRVVGPDTDVTPFDSTTSASRSSSMMGNAIVAAAEIIQRKLAEYAVPLLETSADELIYKEGAVVNPQTDERMSAGEILARHGLDFVDANGEYATNFRLDPETGQGIATPHWHQGAGAAEVEVDLETGKVTVLNYRASSFAGRVINPMLTKLQNDGNVIFGLGPAMMEEVLFDGGQVTNPNLSDYLIPSIRDLPLELVSVALESAVALEGGAGEIHGIGEMTLPPVAPAIANAIEDAVGVRIKDLPITAEKVLRGLKERQGLSDD